MVQRRGKRPVADPSEKELLRTDPSRLARRKGTYSKAYSRRLILSYPSAAGTAGVDCRSTGFAEEIFTLARIRNEVAMEF